MKTHSVTFRAPGNPGQRSVIVPDNSTLARELARLEITPEMVLTVNGESRETFQSNVRALVLDALDQSALNTFDIQGKGWTDADLPVLFRAVDEHADALWFRSLTIPVPAHS